MDQPLQTSSTSKLAVSSSVPAIPESWVEKLFRRLEAILGARMGDVYHAADKDQVKREWAEALYGYSDEELRRGIAATRTRKFPPNLPEFLHLCRPALDPEIAWIEAEEGLRAHAKGVAFPWSHAAVYWAGRRMATELRAGDGFAKHRKRWEVVIAAEFAKGAWASPPDPTLRRLASTQQDMVNPIQREEARARMAEIRKRITGFASVDEQKQAQTAAGFISVGELVGIVERAQEGLQP